MYSARFLFPIPDEVIDSISSYDEMDLDNLDDLDNLNDDDESWDDDVYDWDNDY